MDNSPLNRIDPFGLRTIIIISKEGIGHAGIYIDNPKGMRMLYDPNGSFVFDPRNGIDTPYDPYGPQINYGPIFEGNEVDLANYIAYQGKDPSIFIFSTTSEQESKIAENIVNLATPGFLSCATKVSEALNGVPGFDFLRDRWGTGIPSVLSGILNEVKKPDTVHY